MRNDVANALAVAWRGLTCTHPRMRVVGARLECPTCGLVWAFREGGR